ncbi:hypothetical protein BDA99DRAFT_537296 [Phascolomyces articulosus]|uniref:Uncharacterized protein n=1 Tax=Phascolomyces articulosus TaxID=60185 RepID=A0AAD5K0F3_9FUNG|nr:hypothetical protein BDA99DRAFT_537296 [Phascolomyces articulosus]
MLKPALLLTQQQTYLSSAHPHLIPWILKNCPIILQNSCHTSLWIRFWISYLHVTVALLGGIIESKIPLNFVVIHQQSRSTLSQFDPTKITVNVMLSIGDIARSLF